MKEVLSKKNILVVDDEEYVGQSLKKSFESVGAKVNSVTSAQEAIEQLQVGETDLVIADIRMPEGSGVLILDHMKKNSMKQPIVFISGFSNYFRDKLIEKGAVDVIPKPVKPSKLMALSRSLLSDAEIKE